ncbi:hypothetical protein [Streptacidiphilus cavernicola]|uniref:Uncharacterized protein n=1 Tax=Streptacidiphilus cavernicola TaxID=3342716 RepID=A0ABV6VY88_9ACTN
MGCNCGGGAKARQVSTTAAGVPYTASSVAYRHQSESGGYSDYGTPEQAREAQQVLRGGTVTKVDPISGRQLDCPECEAP